MKAKEKILNLLREHSDNYISGQEIANTIGITRGGVWKQIKVLQNEGYCIAAITNKGYRLNTILNEISEENIRDMVEPQYKNIAIEVFEEIGSTNDRVREFLYNVPNDYCGLIDKSLITPDTPIVCISDYQTAGRGRRGRSFHSPKHTGLYLSFLLRSKKSLEQNTLVTCMAAVALCRALKKVTNIDTDIKWVNDIFINNKKIAGILTEGFMSVEDNRTNLIIGIGINIYEPREGFPDEIKKTAGALLSEISNKNDNETTIHKDIRDRIVAELINSFLEIYNSDSNEYLKEYKERSFLIGDYVKINSWVAEKQPDRTYAKVIDIDDECRLVVQYDDGVIESLSTGEVSVVKY